MKIRIVFNLTVLLSFFCMSFDNPNHHLHHFKSKIKTRPDMAVPAVVQDSLPSVSSTNAKDMVKAFRGSVGYYHKRTSTWFSRGFICILNTALQDTSKRLDGIRVYLGLKKGLHTFLIVPTKDDGPVPSIDKCGDTTKRRIHRDVFCDTLPGAQYPVNIGLDEHGNDKGASLYRHNCCNINQDKHIFYGIRDDKEHAIDCVTGRKWVRHRTLLNILKSDTVNTYSEWFERKFIQDLRDELVSIANSDGVRIYLARSREREKSCTNKKRHVFLWVTTLQNSKNPIKNATHIDYYQPAISIKSLKDNGEQCLNNCNGATLGK